MQREDRNFNELVDSQMMLVRNKTLRSYAYRPVFLYAAYKIECIQRRIQGFNTVQQLVSRTKQDGIVICN